MHYDALPYIAPLIIVVLLAIGLSILLLKKKDILDINILLITILLSAAWATGYSLELLASDKETKVFWAMAQYPFVGFLPVAWYAFALRTAGLSRLLSTRYILPLCLIPTAIQPIIWTNSLHHFFWKEISLIPDGPFVLLDISYGPGFWIINLYSLLIVTIATLYLFSTAAFTKQLRPTQRLILLTIPLLPVSANILYTQRWGPIPNLDLTPFAFLVAGIALAFGFVLHQLERIVLIGRSDIFDQLPQALFIFDDSGNLIDANSVASSILKVDLKQYFGRSAALVGHSLLNKLSQDDILLLDGTELVAPGGQDEFNTTYLVSATSIKEDNGSPIGKGIVLTDITEQKKANNQLVKAQNVAIEAKIQAEAANKAKSEFLSQMSHELRTPLNAVLGFAQLLQSEESESKVLDSQQKSHLEHIEKGGKHLVRLIDDILSLATIETGNVTVELEEILPLEIVDECINLIRPTALKENIDIQLKNFPDFRIRVVGDKIRLKQILLNLLSNAVKYNSFGGRVDVEFSSLGKDQFQISISDTGGGIDQSRQSQVFVPFSRLGAENTEIEGTGIGLALSKTFVELMSGEIGFESQVGEGTTFWIRLPAKEVGTFHIHEEPDQSRNAFEGEVFNKKSILYIEDNALNLSLMRSILDNLEGIRLISAETAEQGIAMIKDDPPDLVLMDINLPGMNGYEAVAELKADPVTQKIPVVAVTAASTEEDLKKGSGIGFSHYLTKPFDINEILKIIKTLLRSDPNNT